MTFHFLHLKNYPIHKQLELEKELLQNTTHNICLINEGTPTPSIVMGISGKEHELVNTQKTTEDNIPILRRFSGGGTVIVDEETLFVTFICQKDLHDFAPYPEPIMRWTGTIYQEVFEHPEFALRENDYVLGNKKCGGNAQYIKKHRWLHHTSFLWDFKKERMKYLLHPKKTPKYREEREHTEFLCTLQEVFPSKGHFIDALKATLGRQFILKTTTPQHSSMKIKSIIYSICLALLTLLSTPLEAWGRKYSDMQLSENTFIISIQATETTTAQKALKGLMTRAAEVTIKNNYRYFVITKQESDTVIKNTTKTTTHENSSCVDVVTTNIPNGSIWIHCFENAPQDVEYVDACVVLGHKK